MLSRIKYWFITHYQKILNSISFYPALIGLLFLVLAVFMLEFDFSPAGKSLKAQLSWLSIKDASTVRSIISAIAAGIISLAVFSFSMVMIVLNQAASQMSNRVLDKLIGNRFQQIVLGIYIGTIVYAFFLLSTIRDIDSGIYIPSLSTYLLIIITILDIFLFIYFLHYITQSVKYEVIIRRIYDSTFDVLKEKCSAKSASSLLINIDGQDFIDTPTHGIYENFDHYTLIALTDEHNLMIEILHSPGAALLTGMPIAKVDTPISDELKEKIAHTIFLHESESIEENFFYGFRQLTEIAIKALSPGINDPATAIIALRALFNLYAYRLKNHPVNTLTNKEGQARIVLKALDFEKIFNDTILPIWDYGKEDRMIKQELMILLPQLQQVAPHPAIVRLLKLVEEKNKNLNQ